MFKLLEGTNGSRSFYTSTGVRQDEVLSDALFSVALYMVLVEII
jgi:hypothetical protein